MRMVNKKLTMSKGVFSVAGEPSAVEPASISVGVFPRRAASSRLSLSMRSAFAIFRGGYCRDQNGYKQDTDYCHTITGPHAFIAPRPPH
jgi:hypothetical protein